MLHLGNRLRLIRDRASPMISGMHWLRAGELGPLERVCDRLTKIQCDGLTEIYIVLSSSWTSYIHYYH